MVKKGALATIGINYLNLGKQTGEMALKVLKGSKPQDMPIESQKNFDTVITNPPWLFWGLLFLMT